MLQVKSEVTKPRLQEAPKKRNEESKLRKVFERSRYSRTLLQQFRDLGTLFGTLGTISERSWELPGRSWSALGLSRDPPGALLGAPGAPSDASRGAPGSSWGRLGALLGAPGPPGGGPELRFPQLSLVFLGFSRVLWLRPKWLKFLKPRRAPETPHAFFV